MSNPFLAPSALPWGLPDTSRITDEHYLPAFEAGTAEQRAEVAAIVAGEGEPTFDDTIVALERSGATLDRVARLFYTRVSADSSPAVREIEAHVAPMLAAHADAIALDPGLFARIDALHSRRHDLGLDAESLRLLERHHRDMVRAGARLGPDEQARLRELNAELSGLTTRFGAALLAGANAAAVHVTDRSRLDGLSEDAIAAAASAAAERGHADGWLITLVLPTAQPALAVLTDRSLREELFRASTTRGQAGEHDTRAIVLAIVRLRAERAALLGYPDHASYVIDDATAGTAEAAVAMLESLVPAAVANADREAAELAGGVEGDLEPWDWAFEAERVRRERYAVDDAALRPYLELDRVLTDGVFRAASELYGISFTERTDLPAYHPDVRWWEVRESSAAGTNADGEPLGLFGADLWARPSKRGGAWMNSLVDQSSLLGTRPVVLNTLNLNKPPAGEPALLTLDEVRTLFHEFGHALHGLFSEVEYPTFSGTSVPRDFVEFPSQVNEMWLEDPQVLTSFARHHVTGEPLPDELLAASQAARGYGEGFATTEYLAASLLDQAWHRLSPAEAAGITDVLAFEQQALEAAGAAHPLVPPRYRSTYFNHVFGGSGYAAAYYSYIWAEVLDADTVAWFGEHGGLRRENGDRFRRAAAPSTRWRPTARSVAATRRSRRCWRAAAWPADPAHTTARRPVGSAGRRAVVWGVLLVLTHPGDAHLRRLRRAAVGEVVELDRGVHRTRGERAGVLGAEPFDAVDVADDRVRGPLHGVVVPLGDVDLLLGVLLRVRAAVVQEEGHVVAGAGGLGEVDLATLRPGHLARPQQQHRVVLLVALGELGAHLPLAVLLRGAPGHAAGVALRVAADDQVAVLHRDRVRGALALAVVAFAVVGRPVAPEGGPEELVAADGLPAHLQRGLDAVAGDLDGAADRTGGGTTGTAGARGGPCPFGGLATALFGTTLGGLLRGQCLADLAGRALRGVAECGAAPVGQHRSGRQRGVRRRPARRVVDHRRGQRRVLGTGLQQRQHHRRGEYRGGADAQRGEPADAGAGGT